MIFVLLSLFALPVVVVVGSVKLRRHAGTKGWKLR